jgi:hypothetical protein
MSEMDREVGWGGVDGNSRESELIGARKWDGCILNRMDVILTPRSPSKE